MATQAEVKRFIDAVRFSGYTQRAYDILIDAASKMGNLRQSAVEGEVTPDAISDLIEITAQASTDIGFLSQDVDVESVK